MRPSFGDLDFGGRHITSTRVTSGATVGILALAGVALGWIACGRCAWIALASAIGGLLGYMLVRAQVPILLLLMPISTVYWQPLLSMNIGSGVYNFTMADANLVILLAIAKLGTPSCPRRCVARIGNRLRLLVTVTWLLAVPSTLAGWLYYSSGTIALQELLFFAKRMGEYALIPVIICTLAGPKDVNRLAASIMVVGSIVCTQGIVETVTTGLRAESWLMYANSFGLYSVVVFNMAMAHWTAGHTSGWLDALAAVAATVSLGGLASSGSRSASIGFVASLAYWMIMRWRRGRKLVASFLATVVVLVAAVTGSHTGLLDRWSDVGRQGLHTGQVLARLEAGAIGVRIFSDYPILGTGAVKLGSVSQDYTAHWDVIAASSTVKNVGNQYLQVAVESGLVGIGVFALWLTILSSAFKQTRSDGCHKSGDVIRRAGMGSFISLCCAGIGMHTFYVPQVMAVLWMIVGLCLSDDCQQNEGI